MRYRIITAFLLFTVPALADDAAPQITLPQGAFTGISDRGTNAYLGISYGAPAVGENRWATPQPPLVNKGVRHADHFGPACMQQEPKPAAPWTSEYFMGPPYSEDCLSLNVWTTGGAGKAVVLFIPGGGFTQGGGGEPVYNGSGMAKAGVVFVSMNYRLSAAGFVASPDLAAASSNKTSGNYALLDMIGALTWIRANIAAFGGDPTKVTVMGQSAGASAIVALLHSPLATGLFRGAIIDSGVRVGANLPSNAEREKISADWAASKGATTLAQMRALPAEALVPVKGAPFRFSPSVDGAVVPDASGPVLNDVPILTGWNGGEGAASSAHPLDAPVRRGDFQAQARTQFGASADAVLAAYSSRDDATDAAHAAGHDAVMMGGALWAAGHGKAPLYYYDFEHVMPGDVAAQWGSYHSSELPYVFNTLFNLNRPWTEEDRHAAQVLQAYWVNFINTGDPNGGALPGWAAFDGAKDDVMALGPKPHMRPIADAAKRDALTRWYDAKP